MLLDKITSIKRRKSDGIRMEIYPFSTCIFHCYDTRNKMLVRLPLCKTNWGQQTSQFMFFKEWNELPSCIKDSNSFRDFKKSYLNNIS